MAETPKPSQPFTLYEGFQEAGYHLKLEVNKDELAAFATVTPQNGKTKVKAEALAKLLKEKGISYGLQNTTLKEISRQLQQGQKVERACVAIGTAPETGQDAYIEYLVKAEGTGGDGIELEEDEQGLVDMRQLNQFTNLAAGDAVATIHPATTGEAGSTVTGKVIPSIAGKELDLKAGEDLTREGDTFYTQVEGRIVQGENSLYVSQEFAVHADVDFSVGDIIFNGAVSVTGDVLDEFDIHASKGIQVGGTVGACTLESQGDIKLTGVNGKNTGRISTAGSLHAHYLNGVTVEAMGNVVVNNEIRNSTIKAGGKILCSNGVISGGLCMALEGIDARIIGAQDGRAVTRITAGVYFPEEDRLEALQNQQRRVKLQRQFISRTIGPLSQKLPYDKSRTGAIQRRLEILQERQEELVQQAEKTSQDLASFKRGHHPTANPKVNVHDRLNEQVVLRLVDIQERTHFERQGPISIIPHSLNQELRYMELSELKVNANQIDAQLIEEKGTTAAEESAEKETSDGPDASEEAE